MAHKSVENVTYAPASTSVEDVRMHCVLVVARIHEVQVRKSLQDTRVPTHKHFR